MRHEPRWRWTDTTVVLVLAILLALYMTGVL